LATFGGFFCTAAVDPFRPGRFIILGVSAHQPVRRPRRGSGVLPPVRMLARFPRDSWNEVGRPYDRSRRGPSDGWVAPEPDRCQPDRAWKVRRRNDRG
jgi:hypothetical protein